MYEEIFGLVWSVSSSSGLWQSVQFGAIKKVPGSEKLMMFCLTVSSQEISMLEFTWTSQVSDSLFLMTGTMICINEVTSRGDSTSIST
jgi:hypothetical protein